MAVVLFLHCSKVVRPSINFFKFLTEFLEGSAGDIT